MTCSYQRKRVLFLQFIWNFRKRVKGRVGRVIIKGSRIVGQMVGCPWLGGLGWIVVGWRCKGCLEWLFTRQECRSSSSHKLIVSRGLQGGVGAVSINQ